MADQHHSKIKGGRRQVILGRAAGWVLWLWGKSIRFRFHDDHGFLDPARIPGPTIFAIWHNQIFVMPSIWGTLSATGRNISVLTSASRDGAMLAEAMAVFGMSAIRGSSSRRGAAALIAMRNALLRGRDLCVTPDGPRGPRYSFQAGIVKLASLTGAPIVPLRMETPRAWRLATWDRLIIPVPFSSVTVYLDKPLAVPAGLDQAALVAAAEEVRAEMLSGLTDIPEVSHPTRDDHGENQNS